MLYDYKTPKSTLIKLLYSTIDISSMLVLMQKKKDFTVAWKHGILMHLYL